MSLRAPQLHDVLPALPKRRLATAPAQRGPIVQPIPTRYMRRQTRLMRLFHRLGVLQVGVVFLLLAVLGLAYALKVSIARRLEAQTTMAKALYEENMQLDVTLNRLKSFQNIEETLTQVPQLVNAREKRTVQSSAVDWQQPILLGEEVLHRHVPYTPSAGF